MTGETFRNFVQSFARAPLFWLLLLIVAVATNLIDLVYGAGAGHAFSMLQILSLIVRFVGVFWLAAAVLRRFAGHPAKPASFDGGIGFFLGWQVALLVAGALINFALWPVETKIEPWVASFADPPTVVLVCIAFATPVVDLLSLRIIPWVVGRTARLDMTLRAAWRGMRGYWGGAAVAYLVLVLPLFAIHYAATAWLSSHADAPQPLRLGWTVFDGIESVVMLMMLLSLYLTAYERAKPQATSAAAS